MSEQIQDQTNEPMTASDPGDEMPLTQDGPAENTPATGEGGELPTEPANGSEIVSE